MLKIDATNIPGFFYVLGVIYNASCEEKGAGVGEDKTRATLVAEADTIDGGTAGLPTVEAAGTAVAAAVEADAWQQCRSWDAVRTHQRGIWPSVRRHPGKF